MKLKKVSISEIKPSYSRMSKHFNVVTTVLRNLTQLSKGEALKIILSKEEKEGKSGLRTALHRRAKQLNIQVLTVSAKDGWYVYNATHASGGKVRPQDERPAGHSALVDHTPSHQVRSMSRS